MSNRAEVTTCFQPLLEGIASFDRSEKGEPEKVWPLSLSSHQFLLAVAGCRTWKVHRQFGDNVHKLWQHRWELVFSEMHLLHAMPNKGRGTTQSSCCREKFLTNHVGGKLDAVELKNASGMDGKVVFFYEMARTLVQFQACNPKRVSCHLWLVVKLYPIVGPPSINQPYDPCYLLGDVLHAHVARHEEPQGHVED